MKARVKATGALLEVRFRDTDTEHPYICDMQGECGTLWKESQLEFLENDPDYWTRLEHQYAGMAIQGIIARHNVDFDMVVEWSADLAHALIGKMKEAK